MSVVLRARDSAGLLNVVDSTNGANLTLAGVDAAESSKEERKAGIRTATLWQGADRRSVLATITTQPGSTPERLTYLVHAPNGAVLGSVHRAKGSVFPPRRTCWTITQGGEPPATGRKGRVVWWAVWIALMPFVLVLGVIGVLGGAGDVPGGRAPRRVIWRRAGTAVLDYRPFKDTYTQPTPWLSPGMAAAVVHLHRSHPAWIDAR